MNSPELIVKLTDLQASVWPTVANQIGEACGQIVQLNGPLVLEAGVAETAQEFALPSVVVQFSFAGRADSTQALLLPLDTAMAWCVAFGEPVDEMDDRALEILRPALEATVQGICLAVGNALNEVVIGSEFSIRIGSFTPPVSMQTMDSLIRVQLALGVDATVGALTWLLDPTTARFVAGLPPETQAAPKATFGALPNFGASRPPVEPEPESHGLDILMDIPLDISVELGRTKLVVREVVDLGVGSIVEIDKAAGEPVDIMVNGRLVAKGEVVVIEDNFGVRITEILNPRERLARLGEAA